MESHETNLAPISKLSFFLIFSDEEKKTLSKCKSHILSFHHNQHIIHQGDFEASLYVLLKGKVYINKNLRPTLKLANLKPGDVFDKIAFDKQISRSASTVAEAD